MIEVKDLNIKLISRCLISDAVLRVSDTIGGCRNSKWPGPDFLTLIIFTRGVANCRFFRLFRADEKILGLWTRLDS